MPVEFARAYRSDLRQLQETPPERFPAVVSSLTYEAGEHPEQWWDYECAFASEQLARIQPENVLDIGSQRLFVIGLLAHYPVTTVDVRERIGKFHNETLVTCDAKDLALPDASFDAVVSLCALEHFGLGRYGDDLDMDGDKKAIAEMMRVLRPGGSLIFSTALRDGEPVLAFNEQRIYNLDLIRSMAGSDMTIEVEKSYSRQFERYGDFSELVTGPPGPEWDIYLACWRKKH